MTVSGFTIPDETDKTGADDSTIASNQSGVYKNTWESLVQGVQGHGVALLDGGGVVSWLSGQTFLVTAGGGWRYDGTYALWADGSVVTTFVSGSPYWAIVSIDASNNIVLTQGSSGAGTFPKEPALPSATSIKLAAIYVDSTTLDPTRVHDRRFFVPDPPIGAETYQRATLI